jgi:HAD superfamily hydrolase (TIGR01662 family)
MRGHLQVASDPIQMEAQQRTSARMIRAVLFDLDDTLLDFDPARASHAFALGAERTYDYLKRRHLPVPPFDRFLRSHCWLAWRMKWIARLTGREQSVRHVLRRLCLKLRLQNDEVSLARIGWLWYEPMTECASVAPDVIPTLKALRDAGLKLAIVCNTPLQGEVIDDHLRMEGLLDFFPVRIYSSDVGFRKPNPRIFRTALDELRVDPGDALYVGDTIRADIDGALKAGMHAVLRCKSDAASCERSDGSIRDLSELLKLPLLNPAMQTASRMHSSAPQPLICR